jgi:hypothetical protein
MFAGFADAPAATRRWSPGIISLPEGKSPAVALTISCDYSAAIKAKLPRKRSEKRHESEAFGGHEKTEKDPEQNTTRTRQTPSNGKKFLSGHASAERRIPISSMRIRGTTERKRGRSEAITLAKTLSTSSGCKEADAPFVQNHSANRTMPIISFPSRRVDQTTVAIFSCFAPTATIANSIATRSISCDH